MNRIIVTRGVVLIICCLFVGGPALCETKELGNGFRDHGKAKPEGEPGRIVSIVKGPNGTICGGMDNGHTSFVYNPQTDRWDYQDAFGQLLALNKQGTFFYTAGLDRLAQWDPLKPDSHTGGRGEDSNPHLLVNNCLFINEACDVLALPDERTIVMGGESDSLEAGNGLLFWDCEAQTPMIVGLKNVLPYQWTVSLTALSEGKLLGGTSIGRSYQKRETQPELYIMDIATKTVEWHKALFFDLTEYANVCSAPNGLVYGIARIHYRESKGSSIKQWNPKRYFVFDPVSRAVVYQKDLETVKDFAQTGPTVSYGGPRAFIRGGGSKFYMLFKYGIAKVDLFTHALSFIGQSPVEIDAGGDYMDGRIYFGSSTNLYSYEVSASKVK